MGSPDPDPARSSLALVSALTVLLAPLASRGGEEPLFRDLPPGVSIDKEIPVTPAQREAVATKLGGRIERLTNATLNIHGRSGRINVITAPDAGEAGKIHKAIAPGKNIRYAGTTGSRWGVENVLRQKSGHCWDFSDLFVTLCRAADVPARQVAGWLYGSSGHVWAEYHTGDGWQQADPTGGGKLPCGIYHIPWFTTNDGHMPIVYLAMPTIEIVEDH